MADDAAILAEQKEFYHYGMKDSNEVITARAQIGSSTLTASMKVNSRMIGCAVATGKGRNSWCAKDDIASELLLMKLVAFKMIRE